MKESISMGTILTQEQLDFYARNHYIHIKGVIPKDLLELMERILSKWVDELADRWIAEGLLKEAYKEIDFSHRLMRLWDEAGRPKYSRSPRRDIVGPMAYEFLKHPGLIDIAADLLGTQEVSVHGIFNARPKLPDQKWTDTPWHQDAQYYRDAENTHVVSMWMPLQRVTEQNSCLQVAPGQYDDRLLEAHEDAHSGFIGLSKTDAKNLKALSIVMEPGDVLCFTQLLPHRALPNRSDAVRWSMDLRYEATSTATASGKEFGFIARSPGNPASETSCEEWLSKWASTKWGQY